MGEGDGFLPGPIQGLQEMGSLVVGLGGRKEGGRAGFTLPKLSSSEQLSVQRAKKYAMEQSIKIVLMKQTLAHQQAQARALQRQQAIVLMCRIYVGSINFEVREETLKTAFGPFGPIKAISMSWDPITQKHKGFAFIDFETPEAAQIALEQMNGTFISGRNIKVGRPSNMPQAQAIIEEIEAEARNYNRLYVGGIHKDLCTEDIRSVFEAFGKIKSCELAPTVIDGRHKGYGFIEYDTLQSCLDAINSMNQFDLGGQYLRVGRAITPPDLKNTGSQNLQPTAIPTASAVAAAAVTAKIQAMDAVAENMGVSSSEISREEQQRRRDRDKRSVTRDSDYRDRQSKSRDTPPRESANGAKSNNVNSSHAGPSAVAAGASGSSAGAAGASGGAAPGVENAMTEAAAKLAAEQAHQLELQKKLVEGGDAISLSQQENMQIKGQTARHLVMQKLMGAHSRESKVLCLKNMVGLEDCDDTLQEEIEDECGKYGMVENVLIYQEKQSEHEDAEIDVKIFVEFNAPNAVKTAREALNGRYFAGRHVRAEIYDQDLYDEQDFSH